MQRTIKKAKTKKIPLEDDTKRFPRKVTKGVTERAGRASYRRGGKPIK